MQNTAESCTPSYDTRYHSYFTCKPAQKHPLQMPLQPLLAAPWQKQMRRHCRHFARGQPEAQCKGPEDET
jgi:hypothetical protein